MSTYFRRTHLHIEAEKNKTMTRKEGAHITGINPQIYSALMKSDTTEVTAFMNLLSHLPDEKIIYLISLCRQENAEEMLGIRNSGGNEQTIANTRQKEYTLRKRRMIWLTKKLSKR